MPDMKGDQLAAAIKRRSPKQAVVMLTAFPEKFQSSACPWVALIPSSANLSNLRPCGRQSPGSLPSKTWSPPAHNWLLPPSVAGYCGGRARQRTRKPRFLMPGPYILSKSMKPTIRVHLCSSVVKDLRLLRLFVHPPQPLATEDGRQEMETNRSKRSELSSEGCFQSLFPSFPSVEMDIPALGSLRSSCPPKPSA